MSGWGFVQSAGQNRPCIVGVEWEGVGSVLGKETITVWRKRALTGTELAELSFFQDSLLHAREV
jgi:hypothetical protein